MHSQYKFPNSLGTLTSDPSKRTNRLNFSESLRPLLSFLDMNHILFGKMEDMILNIMESMPGFKFYPSDHELLLGHLKPKIEGTQVVDSCVMPEIKVCQFDPWQLPTLFNELSVWKSQKGSREWILFCPIKRKYLNSQRSQRTTPSGHWKVTGVERPVKAKDGTSIGTKKTLVFYKGRSPKGKRTNWVMHEYHLNASCLSDDSFGDQLPYAACRLKLKEDKKGVNTSDYPTEDSNNNSPYSSDATYYTHVNKGDLSLFNTPNSVIPEHHQVTGDPYNAADQDEISLDDVYALLPNIQHLDDGPMSRHDVHDDSKSFNYGYMPSPSLSPWNTHDDNSGFGWDYSYSNNNIITN